MSLSAEDMKVLKAVANALKPNAKKRTTREELKAACKMRMLKTTK